MVLDRVAANGHGSVREAVQQWPSLQRPDLVVICLFSVLLRSASGWRVRVSSTAHRGCKDCICLAFRKRALSSITLALRGSIVSSAYRASSMAIASRLRGPAASEPHRPG